MNCQLNRAGWGPRPAVPMGPWPLVWALTFFTRDLKYQPLLVSGFNGVIIGLLGQRAGGGGRFYYMDSKLAAHTRGA